MHAMHEYTLPAGLLITGNMRGELAGFRNNNANQISLALAVHIRNAGVHKATLISYFPAATNFFGFFPGHVAAFPSTAITDSGYITVAGDKLYVELGLGWLVAATTCGISIGYNNANADWAAGDNGIADTNPTVKNPWIEFETTLASAPPADDPLATFSATSVASRPSAPSKPGLQFFDRTTNIESIWNGTVWKEMVSSLNANGGTAIGGNITFSNTTDVDVTLTGSTFTWNAQALSVESAAPRTKTLILTDDATEGAFLTAASTFTVNALALKAPNASAALRIGKHGNLALGGNASLSDAILVNVLKTDYNEIGVPIGLNFSLTNTNTGLAQGFVGVVTGNLANAGASTTNTILGGAMTVVGGAASNNRFQGTARGYQTTLTIASSVVATPVVLAEHYRAGGGLVTRSTVTDYVGFRFVTPTTLLGAITNNYGMLIDSLGIGTNRWGIKAANKIENTATDFLATTAAKGYITKDSQGTPRFWRFYNDATGTGNMVCTVDAFGLATFTRAGGATGNVVCNYVDVGTTAPTA